MQILPKSGLPGMIDSKRAGLRVFRDASPEATRDFFSEYLRTLLLNVSVP